MTDWLCLEEEWEGFNDSKRLLVVISPVILCK